MSHTKSLSVLFLFVVMAAILAACGDDDKPTPPTPVTPIFDGDYFPMADGDTWYFTNDSGRAIVRTVAGDTTVVGAACKKIRDDGATAEAWSISDTAFAVHLLTGADVYVFVPALLVPFNLTTTPYHYSSQVFIDGSGVGTAAGDVTFTGYVTKIVPAGSFASVAQIHYDPEGNDPEDPPYDEFYAAGVGLLDNGDLVLDSAFVGGVWYRP